MRVLLAPDFADLIDARIWASWGGYPTKAPLRADGRPASSTNPSTWATFDEVWPTGRVGLMLRDSGVLALDLDHCREAATGMIATWAAELLRLCRGAYTEVTPSGNGLRILMGAEPGSPEVHTKFKMKTDPRFPEGSLEVYAHASRFITVTGHELCAQAGRHE